MRSIYLQLPSFIDFTLRIQVIKDYVADSRGIVLDTSLFEMYLRLIAELVFLQLLNDGTKGKGWESSQSELRTAEWPGRESTVMQSLKRVPSTFARLVKLMVDSISFRVRKLLTVSFIILAMVFFAITFFSNLSRHIAYVCFSTGSVWIPNNKGWFSSMGHRTQPIQYHGRLRPHQDSYRRLIRCSKGIFQAWIGWIHSSYLKWRRLRRILKASSTHVANLTHHLCDFATEFSVDLHFTFSMEIVDGANGAMISSELNDTDHTNTIACRKVHPATWYRPSHV